MPNLVGTLSLYLAITQGIHKKNQTYINKFSMIWLLYSAFNRQLHISKILNSKEDTTTYTYIHIAT